MSYPSTDYRRDIDGLRAVAVLLVVLYHFELGVSGGFVGVDVFFVISGYLITGIIHRQAGASGFSFLDFYERRARRILPALIVVLTACKVTAMAMLLPSDLERFGASLGATLFFVSNFYFWSQGSYFGPASDLAPLLHTWSLSVEEQFYLAMPPLYLLLQRFAPNRVPHAFALVTLLSLAGASYFVLYRAHEVFYWTPFRVWEIALGGWLAVTRLPDVASAAVRNVAAALGIGVILVAGVLFDSTTRFPGYSALLPCMGATLVIWAGVRGNAVSKALLANRPMVVVGLISYSLYLWHWPLIAFARHHYLGGSVPLSVRIMLATVAVLLSVLSWRYVETPFRSRDSVSRYGMIAWGIGSGVVVSCLAAALVLTQGVPSRYSDQVVALDRERARVSHRDECLNRRGEISVETACHVGAEGPATVLVWGDSYAHAMMPALDVAFRELGLSGAFVGRSGCPPLLGVSVSLRGRANWKCVAFNKDVMAALSSVDRIDTVVVAAAWNQYVDPKTGYILSLESGAKGDPLEVSAASLKQALAGTRVVVIEQVPVYPWGVPYRMAIAAMKGDAMPISPYSVHREASRKPRAVFSALAGDDGFGVVSPESWFCVETRCNYADEHGRPYYFDHGHLNRRGAAFIAPWLTRDLRVALDIGPEAASTEANPSRAANHRD
ncbi:acyltransferase [Flagellatimonas centrodinii]|uniref:acyltransferase family protein n=1 Tax=Flagellatimonas centrodinii TaxID=2806210 RepID=UPI001FED5800|nr:acyltransferase family protein [Flagellatimonas centrodinii]ULQ46703.1 acyltransferase [Flagellatimonas centrodinii]